MKSNFPWSILEHLDLYYNLLVEVTFNDSKEINFRTFGFFKQFTRTVIIKKSGSPRNGMWGST